MPSFASTDGPRQAVPIKNKRYQIPRYPFPGRMTSAEGPVAGAGMLVPWTRVSTILDTHEDKEGIFHWTKRLIVKGIGAREDLYALAAATRLEDKAGLLKVADQAFDYAKGQAASNLGTALHGFLERWVEGDKELIVPSQWKGDVGAVMAAFQDANIRLRPDLQEMVVVRPDLKDGDAGGLAGRLDLVVEMLNPETGEWELIMADYKTGSDPLAYGSWKIQQQLGLYGTAWATWDGEFWRPMPKIRRDKVLMVHVLPGQSSVKIHIGDVDAEALEEDLAAAYRTRRRRKEAKKAWRPLVTVEGGQILGEPTLTVATFDGGPGPVAQQDVTLVPVGPTKPTPLEQSWRASSTPEQVARAEATVARVAAESNPNLDDEQITVQTGVDAEGVPYRREVPTSQSGHAELAPLAGPGERGCGVCGRKGHRRGSPKCLGTDDPRFDDPNTLNGASPQVEADPDEHALDGHADDSGHCRCSTRASGWKAPAVGGGPWVCGDCGLPSKLGVPLSVQTGEQYRDGVDVNGLTQAELDRLVNEEMSDGDHDSRSSALRVVSQRLEDADRAQRERDSDNPRNHAFEADSWASGMVCTRMVMRDGGGDACGATPAEHQADPSPVSVGLEEDMTAEESDPLDGSVAPNQGSEYQPELTETDPFDEDGSDALTPAQPSWLERIQQAPDKSELRAIRADAMAVGKWTAELTQAGLKRIEELKQEG